MDFWPSWFAVLICGLGLGLLVVVAVVLSEFLRQKKKNSVSVLKAAAAAAAAADPAQTPVSTIYGREVEVDLEVEEGPAVDVEKGPAVDLEKGPAVDDGDGLGLGLAPLKLSTTNVPGKPILFKGQKLK